MINKHFLSSAVSIFFPAISSHGKDQQYWYYQSVSPVLVGSRFSSYRTC